MKQQKRKVTGLVHDPSSHPTKNTRRKFNFLQQQTQMTAVTFYSAYTFRSNKELNWKTFLWTFLYWNLMKQEVFLKIKVETFSWNRIVFAFELSGHISAFSVQSKSNKLFQRNNWRPENIECPKSIVSRSSGTYFPERMHNSTPKSNGVTKTINY